jgi:surfeit locus 1 family protein
VITRLRAAGLFWPALMTAAMLPMLLALGTWQLQRKVWKDGLQQQIDARRSAEPVTWRDLGASYLRNENVEYLRVRLEGTFDHATERYLYWPLPSGQGWQVFTLFKPAGGEQTLFINRGWVPDALRQPGTRTAGRATGLTGVTGLVRAPETPGRFTPPNEPAKNIWYWRDLASMRASLNEAQPPQSLSDLVLNPPHLTFDYAIDAEAEPANPGGWPRGGTTNVRLSNRHLEYAFTWYALAATLIGVFCVFAYGRLSADQK